MNFQIFFGFKIENVSHSCKTIIWHQKTDIFWKEEPINQKHKLISLKENENVLTKNKKTVKFIAESRIGSHYVSGDTSAGHGEFREAKRSLPIE